MNPFFESYNTPHETVPFDRIKDDDFEEAIMEGIRRDNEYIDRVVNNPDPPTFENTLLSIDDEPHKYDLLERVTTVLYNLMSTMSNDRLIAIAEKMQPLLTQHQNDVRLNPKLFERVKAVYEQYNTKRAGKPPRVLTKEERRLLNDSYEGFVRSGALLDEAGREKLRALTEELSMAGLQFHNNLLKDTKAFTLNITDEADLDGLPETAREAARMAAEEHGQQGWTITLDAPLYGPFMTYSKRRDLREKLYMAKNTLCMREGTETNNVEICRKLVNLRREVAQLLGYKTFADYVLEHRMASSRRGVTHLLNKLIKAYKPVAIKEVEELGDNLEPWDISFRSHLLEKERYDIDAEMLRPYFKLENVIEGVFGLATTLYGITFKENKDIPTYHPDVKAFEVFDEDGRYLAVLYADFFPREGKQGGAWMTTFQEQWITRKGENKRPHVSIVMNFTKPTADKPSLLTLGEVETFLHEFGHSLHAIFSDVRFESLSCTNVWRDFVELPSQFMENYAVEKDFLKTFARHYETGETIPDELIDKIVCSRNFMVAYGCMRQVCYGLLDMAYYTLDNPLKGDIMEFERKAWRRAYVTKQRKDTCMTVQFSHIMSGGYAAGYYSYKWAEVLDADAFSVFKREGIFNRETAGRFRREILSRGDTEHPMTLYKRFRGSKPTIDALLERNGITATATLAQPIS